MWDGHLACHRLQEKFPNLTILAPHGLEGNFHNLKINSFHSFMTHLPPLNTDTIWQIINQEIDDRKVNELLWYHLGYRYDATSETWDNRGVPEDWREEYPEPPDFIANRPPTVKLTRSIPKEYKQLLKEKLGFKGYKLGEFSPRETRRATAANWLLWRMVVDS
jgi:hypothetical protein